MTKRIKEYIRINLPYFGSITRKYRYNGKDSIVKDKAWSLLSDYVRCRDYLNYGTCVATGTRILDWRESDAGHFHTMSGHDALVGFDVMNIHMQSKISNKLSSAADGANFERAIVARHGIETLNHINSIKLETVKADDLFFIRKIQEVWPLFLDLKAKFPDHNYPDYVK